MLACIARHGQTFRIAAALYKESYMTSGKEDYLKALYSLEEKRGTVSNKELAELLGVSQPSVSEMLVKLQKDGYIEYTAYKGSRLTEKGRLEAVQLTRFHRLWEVFLTDCLGYSWSDAHEEAHALEHHTSLKMAQRLDEYLHHPMCCPHGSVIPKPDGRYPIMPVRPLVKMRIGEESFIRKVTEERELMDYLQELGIEIGMRVRLVKAENYEGPLTLETNQKDIRISYKAAGLVFVDESPE